MAGPREVDYDGSAVVFFVMSLLAVYLVPATISLIWRLVAGRSKDTSTDSAKDSMPSLLSFKFVFFVGAWITFLLLLYTAVTSAPSAPTRWDPYGILGLDESASPEAIKKAYRTLSLKWHPDKNKDNLAEAETRIVDINKAYEVLTNDEARAIWERTGMPDDTRDFTMGIALPKWMVQKEYSYLMLGLYFGLLVAVIAGVWFYVQRTRKFTADDMLQDNRVFFQREVVERNKALFVRSQKQPPRPDDKLSPITDMDVLLTISKAPEYIMPGKIKERPSDTAFFEEVGKYGFNNFPKPLKNAVPAWRKSLSMLYLHLYRLPCPPDQEEDYRFVIQRAFKLTRILIDLDQFFLIPGYFAYSQAVIKLHQMLVQALWERELRDKTCLAQLPHMNNDEILQYCYIRPKKDKDKIRTVAKLMEKTEEERRHLLQKLSDEQYAEMMGVASVIPTIEITTAEFYVKDDTGKATDVRGGDLVTLHVVCTLRTGQRPKTEEPVPEPQLSAKAAAELANTRKRGAKIKRIIAAKSKQDPDPSAPKDASTNENKEAKENGQSDDKKDDAKDDGGEEEGDNEDDIITVKSKRDDDRLPEEPIVVTVPHFPYKTNAHFWIFIVDPVVSKTLGCREFKMVQRTEDDNLIFENEFILPTPRTQRPISFRLSVQAMCDSYIGSDTSKDVELALKETLINEVVQNAKYTDEDDEIAHAAATEEEPAKQRVEERESDDEE